MKSVRLSELLYRPALAIMGLSLALQVFCIVVKIFG
jgi:hypothetical protein